MKLEGYFGNIKKANETVAKLNSQGFKGAFVDINEHDNNAYSQNGIVGTRDVTSQTEAVLGNSTIAGERVSSPLAAASPMVSGMGRFEEVADINCKVVVEVSDGDKVKAESIIKSMDGTTDDPNARLPKGLDNINEDAYLLRNLKE
ncbi:MAG: hypothetical protein AB6733_21595 [Clostridiaceae bacterium]